MAFCSQCDDYLDANATFCENCGAPAGSGAPPAPKGPPPAPKFAPPPAAPTFTPPQTFQPPPTPRHSGPSCGHHQDEPAVASCAGCGRYICEDCCDSYQVKVTEYAGQALCYDCCTQIVTQNVEQLQADRAKIIVSLALTVVGFIIGLIVGLAEGAGPFALVFGAVGACFWMFVKNLFFMLGHSIKAGFSGHGLVGGIIIFIFGMIGVIFRSIIQAVYKVITYTTHIIRTSSFIQSDTQALQQMRDYMEYTVARSNNKGVDLQTLMASDSALYNNSFAQSVANYGEEQATANLANAMFQVNERGEIIRGFAA